jgi:hypothetical protein
MNQHTVIASAILAVAIVAAAWLLKPPCYENQQTAGNENAVVVNRCTGDMWEYNRTKFEWFRTFPSGAGVSSKSPP